MIPPGFLPQPCQKRLGRQGRAFAVMLAVFGEMEAEAIRARVRAARTHLVKSGRFAGGAEARVGLLHALGVHLNGPLAANLRPSFWLMSINFSDTVGWPLLNITS